MKTAVLIVNYDTRDDLHACLANLLAKVRDLGLSLLSARSSEMADQDSPTQ